MILSKVSKKGLVSIPSVVKRALNIEEGDYLVWEIDEEKRIAVVKVLKNPLKSLSGKYDDPNLIYDKVEEEADRIILRELNANHRT